LFLALPAPDDVKQRVEAAQRELRTHRLPVRWVDQALSHITLKFLGNTPGDRVDALMGQLAGAVGSHRSNELVTQELGAFPNPRRPHVLWLGIGGNLTEAQALAVSIDDTAAEFGFARETRAFRPHITVGRWRYQDGQAFDITEILRDTVVPPAPVTVERVQLIRSILRARGPEYTVLAEWPLASAATS
jgi:2'-5' RNA ligase